MEDLRPLGSKTSISDRVLEIKSTLRHIFTWDWIFSEWYEKLIVASAVLWSLYSIFKFAWGLI